jgi:hypothetical protein
MMNNKTHTQELFVGDIVYNQTDINKEHPMTIVKKEDYYNCGEFYFYTCSRLSGEGKTIKEIYLQCMLIK